MLSAPAKIIILLVGTAAGFICLVLELDSFSYSPGSDPKAVVASLVHGVLALFPAMAAASLVFVVVLIDAVVGSIRRSESKQLERE